MNLFQITCFKQHKKMALEKNIRVTIKFYKKHCLPVITWNKNNLLKQVVPITYTLEKMFFASCYTFEDLGGVSFQTEVWYKTCILWSV